MMNIFFRALLESKMKNILLDTVAKYINGKCLCKFGTTMMFTLSITACGESHYTRFIGLLHSHDLRRTTDQCLLKFAKYLWNHQDGQVALCYPTKKTYY